MQEVIPDDVDELPDDLFNKVLESLAKKPGEKYQFIVKSGYSLKMALLNLFKIMWKTEEIPDSWYDTTLIQLFKGRGSINVLDNFCHMHDKNYNLKFSDLVVMELAKVPIFDNMPKFQIACRP